MNNAARVQSVRVYIRSDTQRSFQRQDHRIIKPTTATYISDDIKLQEITYTVLPSKFWQSKSTKCQTA